MRLSETMITTFLPISFLSTANAAPQTGVQEAAACVASSFSESERDALVDGLKLRIPDPVTTAEQQTGIRQTFSRGLDACLKEDGRTNKHKNAIKLLATTDIALAFVDSELVYMGVPTGIVSAIYADIPIVDRAKLTTGEEFPSLEIAVSKHLEPVERTLKSTDGRSGAGRYYSGFKTGYLVRHGLTYLQMRENTLAATRID
jgi:hypothetical protein